MPQYIAPTPGHRISIPAEYLTRAVRGAERDMSGLVDVHDQTLIESTPGAAELVQELDRLKAEAAEASRAVARHSAENVREWQNPRTSSGRLDALNAERKALQDVADALGAEAARARRDLWTLLYVVDAETVAKRRKAAAAEADAQHARAVQALADLHDALLRREQAYATCGHPGDREHFAVSRPAALGALDPSQVFTEGFRVLDALIPAFPTDVAGLFAEAERAKQDAAR